MTSFRWQPPTASRLLLRDILLAASDAVRLSDAAIARLQAAYAQQFDAAEIALFDSGTSALADAMRRTVGSVRRVAVPAYACPDLLSAAEVAGVELVLYDLDPVSLQPDIESLTAALADGVGSFVVVHFFGFPVDMTDMRALAASRNVAIIEDAAQAAGGMWHARPLGGWGDVGVLSFGAGKGTTAGRGGMLVVNDARFREDPVTTRHDALGVAELLRTLALWLLLRPGWFALPSALPFLGLGETHYHPASPVRGMSRFAAALQWRRLTQVEPERLERRYAWRELATGLGSATGVRVLQPLEQNAAGFLRMPLRLSAPPSDASDRLGVRLAYPRTLDEWGSAAVVGRGHALAGARLLARELYTAPVHPRLSSGARRRLAAALGGHAPVAA